MPSLTAIRHVVDEDLGVWRPWFEEQGWAVACVDAPEVDFASVDPLAPDLAIVLGGPMGAYQQDRYPFLVEELKWIERRLASGRLLLAVCLGAQLVATALGARVGRMEHKEIGFAPIALTDEGRGSALAPFAQGPVLHWHGDQFELPEGARLLASSALCPHQAFAWGEQVLAVQFHAETDRATLDRWIACHAGGLARVGIDVAQIGADAARYGDDLARAGRDMLALWLEERI